MATTLSTQRLLQSILASYKVQFPMLGGMATDFRDAPIKLGEKVTAHVRTLPNSASYDSTTGYANGANSARGLLTDVDVTVDAHKFVPILWEHLNNIADQKDNYNMAVADASYVLGREMVDSVLAKFRASNISAATVDAAANVDLETLEAINTAMNTAGASPAGRIGIISSAAAGALALDQRVASRDYYGVLTGANSYRMFRNIAGFQAIYEYPGLSANNAAAKEFTAVAATDVCTATGHGFQTGDRVRLTGSDLPAGLAAATTYYVIRIDANTFYLATSDANATAGTDIDITDAGSGTNTIEGYENVIGCFFEASAIALRAGTVGHTDQLADQLGIPKTMSFESMQDPDSGFALSLVKWQAAGKGDLFVAPASIWGSAVGRQAGAAGAITDKGGHRLMSLA